MLFSILLVGCWLRILYYAIDFSFFLDECALALNVHQRSYTSLFHTLAYDQAAPLGFLYLLKALTTYLGLSEFALRLLPLICGLGAIAAFYLLTRRILSGWALVAANLLTCVNQTAISYSAQAKQYSLELLVTVLMLLLSRPLFIPDCSRKVFWLNSLVLAFLPWFSFSSAFVLAGIAIALALGPARTRSGGGSGSIAGILLMWAILFIPVYIFSIRPGMANPALRAMWVTHYFPLRASSKVPLWILDKVVEICVLSFNKRLWPLVAIGLLCGLGIAILHRKIWLLAGAAGAFACMGAAVLQKYPFSGRLILFLLPVFICLMVEGYEGLRSVFPRRICRYSDLIVSLALLWCLASAVKAYGLRPGFIDEPREALNFVRSNWQSGDRLYATPYSTPCTIYYEHALHLQSSDLILNVFAVNGTPHGSSPLSVTVLPGRDWLVEMRTDWEKRGQSVPVREYFDSRGKRLAEKDVEWTSATLYQIR